MTKQEKRNIDIVMKNKRETEVNTIVRFLQKFGRICYCNNDLADCFDICPAKRICGASRMDYFKMDETELRDMVKDVLKCEQPMSYYEDFTVRNPNASEDSYKHICRDSIYYPNVVRNCPKGFTETTQECKACWEEKMEDDND